MARDNRQGLTRGPPHRSWFDAHIAADVAGDWFEPVLLCLVAWTSSGRAQPIGTGFIIGQASEHEAFAVSAAHNLHEAAKVQHPWPLSHTSALPEFTISTPRHICLGESSLRAFYNRGENAELCTIREVTLVPELDIALMKVRFGQRAPGEMTAEQMAVDTSVPTVGEQVLAMGFRSMAVSDEEQEPDGSWTGVLSRHVVVRRGFITRVDLSGNRVPWPSFETSIPLPGGMSGGPVFWLPHSHGGKAAACGMISRDFSLDEATINFNVAGCSTAAMLYPALGLSITYQAEAQDTPKRLFLLDLIKMGIIKDVGEAATEASLKYHPNGRLTVSRTLQQPRSCTSNIL